MGLSASAFAFFEFGRISVEGPLSHGIGKERLLPPKFIIISSLALFILG